MFTGIYKIYLDGEYVGEQRNAITRAGRSIILKSLMGLVPTVGGEIHIGIDSTANGTPDTNTGLIPNNILGFDVAAAPVRLSYLDNAGNFDAMIFKASFGTTATGGESYKIHELGLFPSSGVTNAVSLRDTALFSGSPLDLWKEEETTLVLPSPVPTTAPSTSCYITSALTPYSFRVGDSALFIKSGDILNMADSSRISSYNLNIYNSVDTLSIAYSKLTGNTPTVTMKFETTVDDYFVGTFAITGTQTYGIASRTVEQMQNAKVGNPRWSNINKITITSDADVVIDAIRFNNVDAIDTVYGMVSRAVLSTPIVKASNSVMDIEYYLSMGFNKTVT
jgi:hypothetical protein